MRLFDVITVPPIWLIALWKSRGIATACRRDRALWSMWAIWAVDFTIGVPDVRRVIDGLTGVRSFTNLPVHILSLCAVAVFFEFVREATAATPGRLARLRWVLLAVSVLGLTALFAAMPRPDGDADLLTANADQPLTQAYWAIFLGYISFACATGVRLCWLYGRHALPGPSRTSMMIVGLANLAGFVYVVQRLTYLTAHALGWQVLGSAAAVAATQSLLALCVLLLAVGMSWPALAERLRRHRAWRQVRAICPLWTLLKAATPENVLPLPRELQRDPDLVLYRYIIEIRDSSLVLDEYLSPADRAAAERVLAATVAAGADREAAVEAVLLLLALRARLAGAVPSGTERTLTIGEQELSGEIDWFRRVAAMSRTKPVERALRNLQSSGRRLSP
ncbi:MAB_1171c family putative transporter [Kitasatospora sp. NPDC001683]